MEKMIYTGIPRQFEKKRKHFAKRGFDLISVPLIQIIPRKFDLPSCDWVLLTSQSPLEFLPDDFLQDKKIAVIGKETATAIKGEVDFISTHANKIDFVQSFSDFKPTGICFYPKSNLADDYIEKNVPNVLSAVIYENCLPKNVVDQLTFQLTQNQVKHLYFSSPSTFQRFMSLNLVIDDLYFHADGATTRSYIDTVLKYR
ncbi:uroporphyrinogen-III synthase [Pseudolactococcus reticulitermitis]|uniref:Tetrapyrrole biosynthesis uroporphyrinogen III synthase domain-containing protein n=1 Tax=Pseudolactococcus reticulitermitis TaxID=2025039 RepID=A0A224WZS9_9LACT|nr:uroporphyrinogen-III synthase [Lactococcus reticulitermitis]GAX47537.1 hypothetical protein RsY01_1137 [Lactococcus reticulitermitis]